MAHTQAADRESLVADFVRAVTARDYDVADRLLAGLPATPGETACRSIADLHMQRQRWAAAAEVLEQLPAAHADARLFGRLCRNLAAIRTHRPEVYRMLTDTELGDAYTLHATPSGKMTLAARAAGKPLTLLSAAADPAAAAEAVMRQLAEAIARGDCLALLSVGDGYFLDLIARRSPELPLGRRQAVYLIEPDARLMLATLLLHDFTGAGGPIERENVLWFVGPNWADAFKQAMHTQRFLPFPKLSIKQALDAKPIEAVFAGTLEGLGRIDTEAQRVISRHYAGVGPDAFAAAMARQADRPPRVLLVTTRFSTVLQYSTRDAADAFRQLGFEAHVLIEPASHAAMTRLAIRRTLADVKPDLVFQIDHNRFEHGDLFPPNVPFVNWIQDLLPHLMTPVTGRKLGENDFVLTPSLQRWVDEYAYPPRQCLEFRKLTRVPSRPVVYHSDDRRVVYVSNWSQTSAQARDEMLGQINGMERDILADACDRMIASYAAGHTLHTPGDCRRLLVDTLRQRGLETDEAVLREMAVRLFDRMNNLLYRQQGLRWTVDACRALEFKLEIFGNGWEKHPDFAPHAAGRIEYGRPLEDLTRAAGMNLVLEPFVCVSHQRLLDALVAGGFCLVRQHPSNDLLHRLIHSIARADKAVDSADTLLAALPGETARAELRQTLADCVEIEASPNSMDFVANVCRQQAEGFLPLVSPLLPHLEASSFGSPESLTARLMRFSRDAELRADIARQQRKFIESRYGYAAGMARVVSFVQQRLSTRPIRRGRAA